MFGFISYLDTYCAYCLMLEIGPRRDVFEALIHFWDHKNNVFCFSDCELTPTLEEIASFMGRGSSLWGSNLRDKRPIVPKNIEGNKFLDYLLGVYLLVSIYINYQGNKYR